VVPSLIQRKRDSGSFEAPEWRAIIDGYVAGRIPDYQLSALLMAVVWRGLSTDELAALTDAMIASGDRLHFEGLGRPVIDKHSTGGVGDKVSLLLAPMVASCGVAVPMMSGRGLGHTGGTLDKLESIPGFRTGLSLREAEAQVARIGCAMIGQTPEIAPADRKLYALRDVTGTVESIPLISASIMSKKLAEGLNGLVLDVKTGSGAFLPELERAIELARTMIALGETRSCRTVALLTAMDRPLGRACGNALEVEEALQGLGGEGPDDLMEVTYALGVEMLMLAGVDQDAVPARERLEETVRSGRALQTFGKVIEAQGGDPAVIDDPGILPQADAVEVFRAPIGGTVGKVEPRIIGRAIIELGGGRQTMADPVDPTVGFVITVKPGDRVKAGQPLASVFARDDAGIAVGLDALRRAIVIGEEAEPLPLISHRITAAGVQTLGASDVPGLHAPR
jgi:pyrimidine-nucleoside phosphorylase